MKTQLFTFRENNAITALKQTLTASLGNNLIGFTLFGSRARGDADVDSDIDLAIIVRGLTPRQKNQILSDVAEIEFQHTVPLSVLVLSDKDFNKLQQRERRIAADIVNEGIAL